MPKMITGLAAVATLAATMALAIPASADAGIRSLAKAECKHERADDPREFQVRFGGMGKAALKRCIRFERKDAKRDCKRERRFDTAEFIRDYGGTGKKALRRCIIDELR